MKRPAGIISPDVIVSTESISQPAAESAKSVTRYGPPPDGRPSGGEASGSAMREATTPDMTIEPIRLTQPKGRRSELR